MAGAVLFELSSMDGKYYWYVDGHAKYEISREQFDILARQLESVVDLGDRKPKPSFPTDSVCCITGVPHPKPGDQMTRCEINLSQLKDLVRVGAADPKEQFNDCPELLEFLGERWPGRVEFIAYIIWPPRSDARVTVEGFIAHDLDSHQALRLATKYHTADELTHEGEGPFSLRAWWD